MNELNTNESKTQGYFLQSLNTIDKDKNQNRKSIAHQAENSSKNLLASDREDLFSKEINNVSISYYEIGRVLRKLNDIVNEKEKHRNYKLISDFEKERSNLENEQAKIRLQIEGISHMNSNEKFINKLKDEKNRQQELFNKYYKMNSEVVTKINKLNEITPAIEEKLKQKTSKLKAINHENLMLMEEIQKLRDRKLEEYNASKDVSSPLNKSSDNRWKYTKDNENASHAYQNSSVINMNESLNMNKSILNNSILKYSEYGNESKEPNKSILNITEVVEENNHLKDKYMLLKSKKSNFVSMTKENKILSNEISQINCQIFLLGKLFGEGMHEIGVELRKVQELQLDKVVKSKCYGNSLYFELVRDMLPPNVSGSCFPIARDFKLPIINDKIQKKYSYPLIEKSEPKTFIYNVIKNMIDEHQELNRNLNVRKRKFDWNEFLNFSPYQLFTLLTLNKDAIKELEKRVFPKTVSALSVEKNNK